MKLCTYRSASKFLERTQERLEQEEAFNNLLLGTCLRLRRRTNRLKAPPYFATVEDSGRLVTSAVRTPPYKLLLHGAADAEALGLIVNDLVKKGQDLPSVLGPKPLPSIFSPLWCTSTGSTSEPGMQQRVYELRSVLTRGDANGSLRQAVAADQGLLCDWTLRFQREALSGGKKDEVRRATAMRISNGELFVWEDRKPVAMAAATRKTPHGVSLNLVYTPPELRRRGYGTACVAAFSQHLLDAGATFCALFADLSNPASNGLYLKIGYRGIGDFEQYAFAPAS